MVNRIITIILALFTTYSAFSQDGTPGNPFTSLDQASNATTSGIYHFNVSGDVFSTYVEGGTGWILIASGDSSTTESSYGRTSALVLQSDMVLVPSIYANSNITAVRMNATSGPGMPFDVVSTDAAVLTNLRNDMTLSINTNSTEWTGPGVTRLVRNCPSRIGDLTTNIYHSCGNFTGVHWQVGQNSSQEKVIFNSDKNNLNLWIQSDLALLPIELSYFDVEEIGNEKVEIEWETSAESMNDYFTIERSIDGVNWEEISRVAGAGDSNSPLTYSMIDNNPYIGWNYYRLKQTDFNGKFEYFEEKGVQLRWNDSDEIRIFPNPAIDRIQIEGISGQVYIFSSLGKDVSNLTSISVASDTRVSVDVSKLNIGVYFIKNGEKIQAFIKK